MRYINKHFFFVTEFSNDNTFAFRVDYLAVLFSRYFTGEND